MGEVYKAEDIRLNRTVAVKISKASFSERFEREAKIISTLNHPHICTLFDIGHHDGVHYLVMEFVEGAALKGPLPADKVLNYGAQIAAALDAAHRKSIIHRDLKPGNILVNSNGVKLLDFGLAKIGYAAIAADDATLTRPLTQQGSIMGTYQYMAPEQLEGKDADARSDIWAFGCVLYEIATGKRAFEGATQASLIGNILRGPTPQVASTVPAWPPALDRVIRRCLAKDPDDRWQSARDILLELREMVSSPPTSGISAAPELAARPVRAHGWKAAAATLAAGCIALAGLAFRREQSPAPEPVNMEIMAPIGHALQAGGNSVRISPDGRHLAFRARSLSAGKQHIWVRSLASFESRPLTAGVGTAVSPFWSPDSLSVGFFSDGTLMRVGLDGTPPVVICEAAGDRGAAWAPGLILFSASGAGLLKVKDTGGTPAPLTVLNKAEGDHEHEGPFLLPDRKRFLFRIMSTKPERSGVYVGSLDGTEPRKVNLAMTRNFFGFALMPRDVSLMVQRLDPESLELAGEPILVHPNASLVNASISANGTLAYLPSPEVRDGVAVVLDRAGAKLRTISAPGPGQIGHFEISPDGSRVSGDWNEDLYLFDLATGRPTRLTFDREEENTSVWSADGSYLYFSAAGRLKRVAASGAGRPVTVAEIAHHHKHVSPDGKFIVVQMVGEGSQMLQTFALETGRKTEVLILGDNPRFSPDGRWIAYDRREGDGSEVYVESWPPGKGKWQISSGGGVIPRWRGDGRELYFAAPGLRGIFAVPISTDGAALKPGTPRQLFEMTRPANAPAAARFDVTPDGQRFIISEQVGDPPERRIRVIVNWAQNMK
jgi:Tol biopolymer transport system component